MRHEDIGSDDEFNPASHLIHKDMAKKKKIAARVAKQATQISSCLRPSRTFFPWGGGHAKTPSEETQKEGERKQTFHRIV